MGFSVRSSPTKSCILLVIATLALGACARRGEAPLSMMGEDDDAICKANNVAAGSSAYVACRRERDAMRSSGAARADTKQRELGQYMLDHPERP
jgi:hypothetical protein